MRYLPILFLLLSCQNQANQSTPKKYFDLAGFINLQTKQLADNQPLVSKNVLVEGKTESLETKKIDWSKELELFLQADLNKQAYQTAYDATQTDSTMIYQLKSGEKLPVKSLQIRLDKSKNPVAIEAELFTKNYLYESHKSLKMKILNNKLNHYQISGSQELFIGNKKEFRIEGVVKK